MPSVILALTSKSDRKSTRLNSSHLGISYAVFCLKKNNMFQFNCDFSDDFCRARSLGVSAQPSETCARATFHQAYTAGSASPSRTILFFFNDTATTEIYTLSLPDALPILPVPAAAPRATDRCCAEKLRWLPRSEEHTSELQSLRHLVCRLLLEKKKNT